MLDSVLYARDKWLAPNGMLFPDKAGIYLTAIEDEEYKNQKFGFWDSVYGNNMSCVKSSLYNEPLVDTAPYDAIRTDWCSILDLNL